MNRAMYVATLTTALALTVTACDSPTDTGAEGGFMEAVLQRSATVDAGAETILHRGDARWFSGGGGAAHGKLQVSSLDWEAGTAVRLQRLGNEIVGPFTVGVHELVPRMHYAGDSDGYTAMYQGDGGIYISESGTWTIREVTEDRTVIGSFEFVAVYWCSVAGEDRPRCYESPVGVEFGPEVPRLHVTGEFRAVPLPPVEPLIGVGG